MLPDTTSRDQTADFGTLRRFLPYLWPADDRALRTRVIGALLLVMLGKAITLFGPYPYKWAIDRMSATTGTAAGQGALLVMALVVAYAAARFGGVVADNVRNVVFERVGQDATRRLAVNVLVTSTNYHCAFISAGGRVPSPRSSSAAPRASIPCSISSSSTSRRQSSN